MNILVGSKVEESLTSESMSRCRISIKEISKNAIKFIPLPFMISHWHGERS
jgi:hypothetical protein